MLPRTKDYFIEISRDHSEELAPSPCYGLVNERTGVTEVFDVILPRIYNSMVQLQDQHDEMTAKENQVQLSVVDSDQTH